MNNMISSTSLKCFSVGLFHIAYLQLLIITPALAYSNFNGSRNLLPAGEDYYTMSNGCPITNPQASLRVGNNLRSTMLLQDINLLEVISHVTHERTIERVVHAKGAGAYGEFEVTHDITKYTTTNFLNTVGKKTKLFTRFSTVAGERGSADSVRDGRGFAFKLYTDEGNLDWLFFNLFWDYFNNNAEGYNALMTLFSDVGTPLSYRYSDIFSINAYKFTKPDGSFSYVKIHLKTNQGVKNLKLAEAVTLSGADPDSYSRDLFDSIASGNFPSWTVYAQIIDPQTAENYSTNIFDATKTISEDDYPLIPFGKITLNENPVNSFSEVEQVAFSPTAIVPGWQISPDPILQVRLFPYGDTQRHRLGVNFMQLPINKPGYSYNPTKRDGNNNIMNYGTAANYISAYSGLKIITAPQYEIQTAHEKWVGTVTEFESQLVDADFLQPRQTWQTLGLTEGQQDNFVCNVAASLSGAAEHMRNHTYSIFTRIDPDLGDMVMKETETLVTSMMKKKRDTMMSPKSKGKWLRD